MYPILQFTNSSNITIQNYSFQLSIRQAVVLSGMSGDVNINYCNFLYQYEGHCDCVLSDYKELTYKELTVSHTVKHAMPNK